MSAREQVNVLITGAWGEGMVDTRWGDSGRRIVPEVEAAIETAWAGASARLGKKLFDGPMCRLEKWTAGARLELVVSRTSYKPFLGTNLMNAHLVEAHGTDVLANAVGLSAALVSRDGWLLFGKRNDSVAYYPNHVHPFAGSLEPGTAGDRVDVFAGMRRELEEEVSLKASDVETISMIGMVEDRSLRQPELVFEVRSKLGRLEIESRLDRKEHHGVLAVKCEPLAIAQAMEDPQLTPVAVGTLEVWARMRWGDGAGAGPY